MPLLVWPRPPSRPPIDWLVSLVQLDATLLVCRCLAVMWLMPPVEIVVGAVVRRCLAVTGLVKTADSTGVICSAVLVLMPWPVPRAAWLVAWPARPRPVWLRAVLQRCWPLFLLSVRRWLQRLLPPDYLA